MSIALSIVSWPSSYNLEAYLRQVSFQTQIGHQLPCMIIQIHTAHPASVGISMEAPTQDACVRDIAREEIARPMHAVTRRPCLFAVAVQPMDNNDAASSQQSKLIPHVVAHSTIGSCPSISTLRPKGDDSVGVVVVARGCPA